jgi:5-methylcytosine-specific restriction protein A
MAWQGSDRRARLPADWEATRQYVLRRDGFICQHVRTDTGRICAYRATDVDHIERGDDHRESNLQALCDYHHKKKSGREGGLASRDARAKRRAATASKHPGLQ